MSNQTLLDDENNRDKKDIKALENELRSIWLRGEDSNLRPGD